MPSDSRIIRHVQAPTCCMYYDCLPTEVFLTLRECVAPVCRYVYQHGYNLSLAELVDKIASPTVRKSLIEWTYKKLDSFPTPIDYAESLATGTTEHHLYPPACVERRCCSALLITDHCRCVNLTTSCLLGRSTPAESALGELL